MHDFESEPQIKQTKKKSNVLILKTQKVNQSSYLAGHAGLCLVKQ